MDFNSLELLKSELDLFHNVGWHLVRFVNNRPVGTWAFNDVPALDTPQELADARCSAAVKFINGGPDVWLCMYSGGRLHQPLLVTTSPSSIAHLARFIGEKSIEDILD